MNENRHHILIVDDQLQNRLLIEEYLSVLDVEIDVVSSGQACLKAVDSKKYSLLCLDVQMPGMDGYQVLEKLREKEEHADIPVIFISAVFDTEEYILKGLSRGALDFIVKPINVPIFINKVSNFLKFYEKQQALDSLVKSLETINSRLNYSERKLKNITQYASDAIILLDKDYHIKFWNKSSSKIFGYSKFELLYEDFFESIISQKSVNSLKDYITLTISRTENSSASSLRIIGKHKNGNEFPIELSIAAFTASAGDINYTVVIRDITERVEMEQEALKAKELKESNIIMKEFIDSVSHELRTPMNAILGISNMLMKYGAENLTNKQREGLEIIRQSGSRLLDLINDLLDLSRLEANRVSVNYENIEFDKFLATLHSMVLYLIGEKKIRFMIRKSSGVPKILYTDQKKLNQILTNLLGNAAKFTKEGRIILKIHNLKGRLFFEVSDTGIGIAREHLETIFERFRQIDNSETKEYEGTGLGLNICKKLVLLMNGEIWAESNVGQGTVMKFYLPVQSSEKVIQESYPDEEIKKGDARHDEIKIEAPLAIIIQDNKDHNFWFANLLKTMGIEALAFDKASEAMAAVKKYLPDLILLKYEMPEIHGASILSEISKLERLKNIPIAVFTVFEGLKLRDIRNPIVLLKEPVDDHLILKSLEKLNIVRNRHNIKTLIIYEGDNHFKNKIDNDVEIISNTDSKLTRTGLARRKIENLIIDGFKPAGQNLLLLKWLQTETKYLPENIYVISGEKPSATAMKRLNKLPAFQWMDLNELNTVVLQMK